MSTDQAAYEFIGTLAMALVVSDLKIRVPTLQKMLGDKGMSAGEHHGIAQVVWAAYQYWEDNPRMQQAIAAAFTGPDEACLFAALVPAGDVATEGHTGACLCGQVSTHTT
jgi:hypothetical protein